MHKVKSVATPLVNNASCGHPMIRIQDIKKKMSCFSLYLNVARSGNKPKDQI